MVQKKKIKETKSSGGLFPKFIIERLFTSR